MIDCPDAEEPWELCRCAVPMMCCVRHRVLRLDQAPAERATARSRGGVDRAAIVAVAVVILAAAVLSGCGSSHASPTSTPTARCGKTVCPATINTVKNSPVLTEFSGHACAGARSSWFLNVVQGGGGAVLRPSYRLNWSFSNGTSASPSGTVSFGSTGGAQASATLVNGALTISGKSSAGKPVTGRGSLSVELTGTSSAPTLTLTESGLDSAEAALGFRSPFVVNATPVVVPITVAPTVAGC